MSSQTELEATVLLALSSQQSSLLGSTLVLLRRLKSVARHKLPMSFEKIQDALVDLQKKNLHRRLLVTCRFCSVSNSTLQMPIAIYCISNGMR